MTYREYLSALDAASAWTREERTAIAEARAERDVTRKAFDEAGSAWSAAGYMSDDSRRRKRIDQHAFEQAKNTARLEHDRALAKAAAVEEDCRTARFNRERVVKGAWQAECDRRTIERRERQGAAGPERYRVTVDL